MIDMPSIRLTVALNSNQSTKTPLLIPPDTPLDPSASKSCYSLVLTTAKSKLRLKSKKPARVFVQRTGEELLDEEGWKGALKNDIVLLVSGGEEYVGLRKEATEHSLDSRKEFNPDCPIVNLSQKSLLDALALTQLTTTARTLPGIIHACGQPDLHPGTKFPIGAVFVSQGWIHPPLIGSDIGCGMAWYRVNIKRSKVDGDQGRKVADRLRGLEGLWRSQKEREAWLTERTSKGITQCWSAGEEWDKSLGTIGAGNHFAEIQVIESSKIEEMREDEVVLLVHSGSRGFGGHVLKSCASDAEPSMREDDNRAMEYLMEHKRACQWAKANRDLIALRFLACLEPGEEAWKLGASTNGTTFGLEDIERTKRKIQARKIIDIWHNNMEKIPWPPRAPTTGNSDLVTNDTADLVTNDTADLVTNDTADLVTNDTANLSLDQQQYAWVHRKGAAPTYNPNTCQPLSLLPLPGSRSTPTLILRPKFSESTGWGSHNALSLAHGAGRSMSRAKALASLGQKYKNPDDLLMPITMTMESNSDNPADIRRGSWVICEEKELVWEEAPQAYKDVLEVADDLQKADVAEVLGWCRPRVSYKIRRDEKSH